MTKSDTEKPGFSNKQIKALPIIAASASYKQGCKQAGIARNTLYEWLRDPVFQSELRRQQGIFTDEAINALKANIGKAIDALVDLLDTESESLRRGVANDVIGFVLKAREIEDIEVRLSAVEKALSDRAPK